jgi:hypothetical protein
LPKEVGAHPEEVHRVQDLLTKVKAEAMQPEELVLFMLNIKYNNGYYIFCKN